MSTPLTYVAKRKNQELLTVISQRADLAIEEFPDGPCGSPLHEKYNHKKNKWQVMQRSSPRFGYEEHRLHEGIPREYPGEDQEINP